MYDHQLPDDTLIGAMAGNGTIYPGVYSDPLGLPEYVVRGDQGHASIHTPDGYAVGELHGEDGRVELISDHGNTISYIDSHGIFGPSGDVRTEMFTHGNSTEMYRPDGSAVGHIQRTDTGTLIFTPQYRRHEGGPV